MRACCRDSRRFALARLRERDWVRETARDRRRRLVLSRSVANRILARGPRTCCPVSSSCLTVRSKRRNRRVSSCTRTVPILGKVTERGWLSPTRMQQVPLLFRLLRSRKLSRQRPLRLAFGNPVRPPLRVPARDWAWAASARPKSTAASSNTCAVTSCRHIRPVTCLLLVPSEPTTDTRPASSDVFQALNALIRSNPDQGTDIDGSSLLVLSAELTSRKHWL